MCLIGQVPELKSLNINHVKGYYTMTKITKSQNERILTTLDRVGFITNVKAKSRGIKNLRARIFELRQEGHDIETIPYVRKDKVVAAKYVLD